MNSHFGFVRPTVTEDCFVNPFKRQLHTNKNVARVGNSLSTTILCVGRCFQKKRIGDTVLLMRMVMAKPGAEVKCVRLALSPFFNSPWERIHCEEPKQTTIWFSYFIYFHNRHTEFGVDIGDIEIKLTADGNLGDLQLGRVGQKYILDPDLRGILSCAVLDDDMMIPYQDQELFLITLSLIHIWRCRRS